jgi:hypothetical protein
VSHRNIHTGVVVCLFKNRFAAGRAELLFLGPVKYKIVLFGLLGSHGRSLPRLGGLQVGLGVFGLPGLFRLAVAQGTFLQPPVKVIAQPAVGGTTGFRTVLSGCLRGTGGFGCRLGNRSRLLHRLHGLLHHRFGRANLTHGFSGTLAFLNFSQDIIYIVTLTHDNLRA